MVKKYGLYTLTNMMMVFYEGNKSVILTSAIKKINEAAYQMIEAELNDKSGGQTYEIFDDLTDGIGIPAQI